MRGRSSSASAKQQSRLHLAGGQRLLHALEISPEQIRRRVTAIVPVPKSEKATLAIVKGVSVLEISPRLREAYIHLTRAAVRALAG